MNPLSRHEVMRSVVGDHMGSAGIGECYNGRLIRESLEFDVVIVGAGPAGLAAACRLAQQSATRGLDLSIAVVEKAAEVGAHIVSGAVIDTRALAELFPDWRKREVPLGPAVVADRFAWLASETRAFDLPAWLVPRPLRNAGHHVASLGRLCRWLATEAESLGCDVLTGFAATELLIDDAGCVAGIATGARGVAADGSAGPDADPGYELRAHYVLLAEGCHGNLGRDAERRFGLREGRDPQHYGIGFKEIWVVPDAHYRPGHVDHTLGWPLDGRTEGGGFVYHAEDNRIDVGFVVALNYRNPFLNPFEEFQRFKQHPRVRTLLETGQRIGFGARAVNKGGIGSLPRLSFPGGLMLGCDAGFLNGAKIKGTHTAMKSGLLAADTVVAALAAGDTGGSDLVAFEAAFRDSWLFAELEAARNFSAGIARFGTLGGGALAFLEHNLLGGRSPLRLRHPRPDHASLLEAARAKPIAYDPPDGVVSFDRLSSIHLANIEHDERQPCHLLLEDPDLPIAVNLPRYDEPAQRYCPAAVYEIVAAADGRRAFRINAGNCIHCKTCEIKDPAQNIRWSPPEGGSGPQYADL
jgi:electron-transferring-flavoprotein dehydrogenase